MNWGEFIALMFIPDLIELITKQLEVFIWATRWTISAGYIMRSFVCKYFNPNRFQVVFQFRQGHVRNVLMDEEYHSATMTVSVLPRYCMLYGHVSRNNSGRGCYLSCQSLFPEYEGCELQGKPKNPIVYPYTINVQANEFQSTKTPQSDSCGLTKSRHVFLC